MKTLSDKIIDTGRYKHLYPEDVKEFIRAVKEDLCADFGECKVIDKLAGDKLI